MKFQSFRYSIWVGRKSDRCRRGIVVIVRLIGELSWILDTSITLAIIQTIAFIQFVIKSGIVGGAIGTL